MSDSGTREGGSRAAGAPEPPELPLPARPAPARLILVRHGESTWNAEHRIQGQLDPPLSDQGLRQAEHLAGRLAKRRFVGFYTSDLARARQTARAVAARIGKEPEVEAGLREVFLGEWEGLHTAELAERYPSAWESWTVEPSWDLVPGGEGGREFEARVNGTMDRIIAAHPHGDVLVVTHGGVIQVALHRIVGRPSQGLFPFRIQNTSISVIEKRSGRFVISSVNDTGHLENAGVEAAAGR
jgi:probable phosphoglycerate mutase